MPDKERSYYGAFFWLALAAFVAPVFVAFYAFEAAPGPYSRPDPAPNEAGIDHGIWDYLLKTYVRDGLVDYGGIERDHLFKTYLRQLGTMDLDKPASEDARLATLINAYNVFVIDGVIRNGITGSVDDFSKGGKGFFKLKEHILAGKTVSCDHVEHGIIRVEYEEPRIHMAVVCAARSCPPLRREAYVGSKVREQLEDQAQLFANDTKYVRYDADEKKLFLSAILKWYGGDFDVVGGYLEFLHERIEDEHTKAGVKMAMEGEAEVGFMDYNWALNSQKGSKKQTSGGGGDFGSGSIPEE